MADYQKDGTLQVVSYTAPTGAGKTVIMASVMERIFYGDDQFEALPDAIIVWLSDSPELNKQSKDKIDAKADKILLSQTQIISEESFDQELLSDGMVYFLNTQKLSRTSNLTRHSDSRQYTIWETLANTVRGKSDRLYFIIDEAHRGMRGTHAATATTIMQKFLKGSEADGLPPMPVVIGITATSQRFLALTSGLGNTTTQRVTTTAEEVRASGLLKERIIIEYPDSLNNEMAVLQAAADEWKEKVLHWEQYCREQHYAYVNPIFVVQVQNGVGNRITETDLDGCLSSIKQRTGIDFKEGEVVHTFGQTSSDLLVCGLKVRYEEPSRISDDKSIKLVFFKENLSTGWDCPRAETMMSFRRANDSTYIAQLLGRMVRTPMRMHINVDDSLNEVRLFLPYFDETTVSQVVEQLQSDEAGNIASDIVGQSIGERKIETLSVNTPARPKQGTKIETKLETKPKIENDVAQDSQTEPVKVEQPDDSNGIIKQNAQPQIETHTEETDSDKSIINQDKRTVSQDSRPADQAYYLNGYEYENTAETEEQPFIAIDRIGIIQAVNSIGLLSYDVRSVKINNYLKSLLELSRFLSQTGLDKDCKGRVTNQIIDIIKSYIENLHSIGKYEMLANEVMQFKLRAHTIDVYGNKLINIETGDLLSTTDADLDRQLRLAESKLSNEGICNQYGQSVEYDENNPNSYKLDIILFTSDSENKNKLESYAKREFHSLQDKYRLKVIALSDQHKKRFNDIVSNGDIVSEHNFELPESVQAIHDLEGQNYDNHLYLNSEGEAWIKLNTWEQGVLCEEMEQAGFVCWVRNMPRKPWALTIPYTMDRQTKPAYPDFLIIRNKEGGGYIIDVLEPHDPSRNDNLPKAKGFAEYSKKNPAVGRLQLIRAVNDVQGQKYKRLDLTKSAVIESVLEATTNDDLNAIFDSHGEFMR